MILLPDSGWEFECFEVCVLVSVGVWSVYICHEEFDLWLLALDSWENRRRAMTAGRIYISEASNETCQIPVLVQILLLLAPFI